MTGNPPGAVRRAEGGHTLAGAKQAAAGGWSGPGRRRGAGCVLLAIACLWAAGCGDPGRPSLAGKVTEPTLSDLEWVVPSEGLPAEVSAALQNANNNLDAVFHDGRFYLAFRTAPTHFASEGAEIFVVSSPDRRAWAVEARFHEGRDLREPRFLAFDQGLFLYYARLGTDPLDFEPGDMKVTERLAQGAWTRPEPCYAPGFIPWRTKAEGGVPYMLTYLGGENIYDFPQEPIYVHWLTTRDGRAWVPVVPGQPVVLVGGGSETDFVFLDDGSLVAVSRNELGDDTGWGMKVCRAEAGAPGDWDCAADPRKYDSPLLFRHGAEVYLIGRRNVTETGNYNLGLSGLPPFLQTLLYEADYWFRPKRCSLWRVHPGSRSVEFVLDLPSAGDTCFPGLVPLGGGRYLIYNYTSPLGGEADPFWLQGQLGPTLIYSVVLALP